MTQYDNYDPPQTNSTSVLSFQEAREEFERAYLIKVMHMTKGNVTLAAKLAERNRTEFYRLLSRHNLKPAVFKTAEEDVAV